jgi:hypothetical protein
MGREYVSELRPSTGLLFMPQVIWGYGNPRWIDIDREKRKNSEEKLSQCHVVYPKSRMDWPGRTRASVMRGGRLVTWDSKLCTLVLKTVGIKISSVEDAVVEMCSAESETVLHWTQTGRLREGIVGWNVGQLLSQRIGNLWELEDTTNRLLSAPRRILYSEKGTHVSRWFLHCAFLLQA